MRAAAAIVGLSLIIAAGWLLWGSQGAEKGGVRPIQESELQRTLPSRPVEESLPARQTEKQELNTGNELDDGSRVAVSQNPNCTINVRYVPNDDGTVTESYSCDPELPTEPHPYEYYDDQALRELAFSDGIAAEILGERLSDSNSQESLGLYIRAAALRGGDPTTLLGYSNLYPTPERINGELVLETVRIKYVLSKAAVYLGGSPGELDERTADVVEAFPHSEDVIARFDTEAQAIIEQMRDIEIEVTGSSSIGLPATP